MIKLQRIGHILFTVRDLERSKAFYTNILGFKVLEQDPHGDTPIEFERPSAE